MAGRRRRSYRRPAWRRSSKALAALVLLAVALLARWGFGPPDPARAPDSLDEGSYQVQRVVDGDTLLLTNGAKIRLIGADTPETVKPDWPVEPWGPEATEFTRQFVGGGEVRLQFDRERKDPYQRFLAYVWVDNKMLNEELIREGLARAETQYHYSAAMKARFRRAEKEAQDQGLHIWSDRRSPQP